MWWPWLPKQIPATTSDGTGRPPAGCCERCHDYAMVVLGGYRWLCWEHYCQEMRAARVGETQIKDKS